MLSAADFAVADWDKLSAGLLALSARRALAARQGERMLRQKFVPVGADEHRIADQDFPAVEEHLNEIDRESVILAQPAHAFTQIGRFMADEQSGRPTPVASASSSPSGRNFLARAIAKLPGASASMGAAA